MMYTNWPKLTVLLLLMIFTSCVGEVESSKAQKTEFFDPAPSTFPYQGILDARAIAHNKIEIDFFPAGDPTVFKHYLQVNGSKTPIELQLDTIPRIDGGVYRYALTGLNINSYYTLKITAENIFTGAISTKEKVVEDVRTFDNRTADFKGISKVYAIPGSASSAVMVEWNPALFEGVISASSYDPVYYEIIYISEAGGYSNLNNSGYSGPDRVVLKGLSSSGGNISNSDHPTFKKITGLQPDTTYYFQVRAVHKVYKDLYDADPNNVPIDREQNSVYIRYTTAPITNFVDFDKNSVVVNNSPADLAFTSFRMNWDVGEGTYTHYRVYVTEYEGADIANDDELIISELDPVTNKLEAACVNVPEASGLVEVNLTPTARDNATKIGCFDVPTTVYNLQIKNLLPYTGYHVKVALCRDAGCPLEITNPNAGILSEIRYVTTEPSLAGFDGLNFVVQPQDPDNLDTITLSFNAPNTASGFADTLEVYCLDPADYNQRDLFPEDGTGIPAGTANVSRCAGLVIETEAGGPLSSINSFVSITSVSELKIIGTKNQPDPDATYCFAMTPAITDPSNIGPVPFPSSYRMNPADMVVRCISPEVKVPTSDEFPGVIGNCVVTQNSARVYWDEPSGGVYKNYTVFMKQRNSVSFNFGNAIADPTGYTLVDLLGPSAATDYQFDNLEPGSTYEIGVLTHVEDGGGTRYYSEPNLSVVECKIPLPVPTFNEWTRIFAIGPKINGRFPTIDSDDDNNPWPTFRTADNNDFAHESRMYEALSMEGIPYEVGRGDEVLADNDFWSPPPGDKEQTAAGPPPDYDNFVFTDPNTYDGAPNSEGLAASKEGIISLAWKDVTLSYLNTEFQTDQAAQGHDRQSRLFGYRVYRSSDYGLSYQLISGDRLIRAIDYSYRVRANEAPVTERMAFFTDYSVRYVDDFKDISRARVYQYKVVPVYNGIELMYNDPSSSPQHMIRVTLPPPNMALVHRMMANRSTCMELEKDIEHLNNYACEYNGLGARARNIPWLAGQSVFDLGGDLLIDRYELGCNFTRGDLPAAPGTVGGHLTSNSYFDKENDPSITYDYQFEFNTQALTDFSIFQGNTNGGSPFRGCGQKGHWGYNSGSNYDNGYDRYWDDLSDIYGGLGGATPTYNDVIFGDCYGASHMTIPGNYTTNPQGSTTIAYNSPGLRYNIDVAGLETYDEGIINNDNPHYASCSDPGCIGLFDRDLRRSRLAIGEFAAVYYNSSAANGRPLEPLGPGFTESDDGEGLIVGVGLGDYIGPNCFVNLASIGANSGDAGGTEYWRSRWFPMGMIDSVITKTQNEVATLADSYESLYTKTLDEITQSNGLYDDNKVGDQYFKNVDRSFWDNDRIHQDMPLGRVVTSNNAKLPGVYAMSPREYNKVCSTYKVQVGVQGENGEFSAMGAPKSKRILRRNELIIAATYPDSLDETRIDYVEKGTQNDWDVSMFINNKAPDSCHSQTKAYPTVSKYGPGTSYRAEVTDLSTKPSAYKRIVTGTGKYEDGMDNLSSETCMSRYGIQDLTGNGVELSSEELFCDYGQTSMAIYYGKYSDSNGGSREWSVIYPYHNSYSSHRYQGVLNGTPIKFHMNPGDMDGSNIRTDLQTLATLKGVAYPGDAEADNNWQYFDDNSDLVPDGIQRINNRIWKYVFADAGYCSLVDSDKNRVETLTNFRSVSSVVRNVFNPDGSTNTTMIQRENSVDQASVESMRNGDGYFLNFGASNLAPSMSLNQSLASEPTTIDGTERMIGMYFNPVVGFPLSCDNYGSSILSCDTLQSGDNKEYTLENFWVNHPQPPGWIPGDPPVAPATVTVKNFPIGNSKFETDGISEADATSDTILQSVTIPANPQTSTGRFIEEFNVQTNGSVSYIDHNAPYYANQVLQYFHMRWIIPRESVLIFANGEKGRFSLRTLPRDFGASIYGHDKSARCAIKINED